MSRVKAAYEDSESISGFRLSPVQADLWRRQKAGHAQRSLAWMLAPEGMHASALAAIVATLSQRHDQLRIAFRQLPWMTAPLQTICEALPVRVEQIELHEIDYDDSFEALRTRLLALPAAAFDGSEGALWCAVLADAGSGGRWLALVASPLVADGDSLLALLGEIDELFRGRALDPPGELQFLHYSEWANDQRNDDALADAQRFWDQTGAAAAADLVMPGRNSPCGNGHGSGEHFEVQADTADRDAATTLAAWAAVVGRLSQSDDFLFGVVHPGRFFEELNAAVGPFAELLPTRVAWRADETLAEVAARVGALFETAAEQLPLADQVRRRFDRPGLGFSHRRDAADAANRSAHGHAEDALAEWALLLSCRVRGERMRLNLRYNNQYCSAQQARYLLGSLAATLDAPSFDADSPHPAATMVTALRIGADEYQQTVQLWNEACVRPQRDACIHRVFEEVAQRTPNAPAVHSSEAVYSYAQLDARANRLAQLLLAEGVTPGAHVAIAVRRCADLVTALLAVLKAGCVYVPLDPDSPPRRLAMLAERASIGAVICNDDSVDRLDGIAAPKIAIDEVRLAQMPAAAPSVSCGPHDPAYMIFTSGSTGLPKAVVIEHRSAVNLARALQAQIYDRMQRPLRLTLNAPVSFDASVKQIVQLLNGHCLHVIPEEARRDGEALLNVLHEQRIDGLDCTPSHLKLLLAAGFAEYAEPWPSLVLVGGEPIDPDTWQTLAAHPAECFNMYGPTETTVNASFAEIAPGTVPNIGHPVHNVRLYILDDKLQPLPVGVPGELCIGGLGVGRGYFDSEELTAQRFLDDPFVAGGRLYRSGDIARWSEDGAVEFIGRNDDQVKIRGFRIELGEIAAALREHPGIGDAVVTAAGDKQNAALVAYVTTAGGEAFDAEAFKSGLAAVNSNETAYLYEEIFAKHTYVRHGIRLFDGACVFDIGANIGMFSMYVAQHCRNPRVYAFEPLAPIHDRLQANLGRHLADAQLFRIGLSAQDGSVEFTYYPGYSMMSGQTDYADPQAEVQVIKAFLRNEQADAADSAVLLEHVDELLVDRFREVRHVCTMRRLSDVIREQGVTEIDLLKIDVQRSERDVLDGIDDAHWACIQQIVMEVHDATGTATEGRVGDLLDLLEDRGYRVEIEQDPLLRSTDRYNLYAWRPEYAARAATRGEKPRPQPVPAAPLLNAFLAERLPDYMIPAHCITIAAIPLTSNGKLDRAALPEPGTRRPDIGQAEVQPDCWQERALAEVWADVLHLDRVGVEDDFFQIGGDSIRSIQAQAQAKRRGLNFALQALFKHHTIRQLVRNTDLAAAQPASIAGQPFALLRAADRAQLPEDAVDAYPLAALQAGMVYHTELTGQPQTYHNVTSYRLGAALDETLMRRAINDLAATHPLLRTSLHFASYSEPLQIVHCAVDVPLPVSDLVGLNRDEQLRIVDREAHDELRSRFDWERPPLVRFRAYRLSDDECMLTVAEYHAILDGWSLHLLLDEIRQRYAALIGRDSPPPAPPPHLGYARFIELEMRARDSAECRAFWRDALAGAPRAALPREPQADAAFAGGADGSQRDGLQKTQALHSELAAASGDALRQLAQSARVPLKSLLLAVHMRVMAAACGVDDVVTGLVTNGRPEEADGDRIIGLFINTLPLRVRLGDSTWLDLAARCFEAESRIIPHRWMPMAEIHRMLTGPQPDRAELPGMPLFEAFFNFTHFHLLAGGDAKDSIALTETRTHPADVDIPLAVDFEIDPGSGVIVLLLQYDANRLSPATVGKLQRAYLDALAAVIEDPAAVCTAAELPSLRGLSGDPLPRDALGYARDHADRPDAARPDAPPQTPLEHQLAALWSDVLGIERIGRDETFAALGGHSLLATRLLARIRQIGGLPLSLQDFYCGQTIAGLAQLLRPSPRHESPVETAMQETAP